ncbi:DinB family protein [Chitinophaga vietnamensis]|uniref:DinB family protein n=1 Tax=Chitinophaga vietnamensis TaxID=2593957 RepID=UPI00119FEA4B|nr:DinB family protein [Chitinophaga vietnamensis]
MLYPSLLSRLQTQHESFAEIVHMLSDEQLKQPPAPGKWSAQDQVAHQTAYQHIFLARVKRMLEEEAPMLDRYVGDEDPYFIQLRSLPVQEVLAALKNSREAVIRLVTSLSGPALQRKGLHPLYKGLTIAEWTDFFVLHEAHHLFTAIKIAAQLRAGK